MKAEFRSFGFKIFFAFISSIFLISFAFTAFYIRHQTSHLTDALIEDGKLLAGILASSARIGVFSENSSLLQAPVEGIFQYKGVLAAAVFNLEGRMLYSKHLPDSTPASLADHHKDGLGRDFLLKLKSNRFTFHRDFKTYIEIWGPVTSRTAFSPELTRLNNHQAVPEQARLTGFVLIGLDRQDLNRQTRDLLIKSLLIGACFLIISSLLSYIVVHSITLPLRRLTDGVKIFGRGGAVPPIDVQTEDEIGNLANAFNRMYAALKKREQEVKASESRLRVLSVQLLETQEQERKRVSKELHDELGQALAVLKHRVRSIQKRLPDGHAALKDECRATTAYIDVVIENVRRLSRDLSPSILEDLGLTAALGWLMDSFEKQHSLSTSIDLRDIDRFFAAEEQTNLYRLFQEALTNIGKHAQAEHVSFSIAQSSDFILFELTDDGVGFDFENAATGNASEKGMGLTTIRERANMLNARLQIESRPGRGTHIVLKVPTTG